MTVTGDNRIELTNLLVGDVWLCGGQSNMEYGLKGSATNGERDRALANDPSLRLFHRAPRRSVATQTHFL